MKNPSFLSELVKMDCSYSLLDAQSYSPFGTVLDERNWSSESYRYGFNGKEKDKEGMGGGSQTYDYGFRIYNPALAKFLSVDPLYRSYPWYTPYQFAGNAPIWAVDLDGLEQAVVVRWYDANNSCTGQTIFVVTNTVDRPLGQNNFLFMNLPDTPNNGQTIDDLSYATSTGLPGAGGATPASPNAVQNFLGDNTQGSTSSSLSDFQGNPIAIQSTPGNLANGAAFTRDQLCRSDQFVVNNIQADIAANPNAHVETHPTLSPVEIFFDDESSTYNGLLDIDNDGTTNDQELSLVVRKLNANPDLTATVTGHTSIEDAPGGTNNNAISNNRAVTVFNLIRTGVTNFVNRVFNGGGLGSQGADTSSGQNTDGQPSKNRKAIITYDIPVQTQ